MAESLASKGNGDMTSASDSPAAQWSSGCLQHISITLFNLKIIIKLIVILNKDWLRTFLLKQLNK